MTTPTVSRALDWVAIQFARRSSQRGLGRADHGEIARALLAQPNLFAEHVAAPPEFHLNGTNRFEFPSTIRTPWECNNRVYGRFYRCEGDWRTRPSVLLVHGWNGELNYYTLFPWLAGQFRSRGYNTALLVLPYHAGRKPYARGAMHNFISDDVPRVIEATQQSVADIRGLASWLRAQGCPQVVVGGFSLGGWLTGLIACVEQHPQRYILATPIVSMQQAVNELPFCSPLCEALAGFNVRLDRFDLCAMQPKVPPGDVLIMESLHDLFVPAQSIEGLWKAWNEPAILRLPHGHISVLCSPSAMKKMIEWVVH